MFNVIEFEDQALGIVSNSWLTPRKKECLWPPYKTASKFNKCLLSQEIPDENWPIYVVKRVMYETDNLQLAREKCKKAESESDLVSDSEQLKKKRKRKPNVINASDTEDEEDENHTNFKYPDPPNLELSNFKSTSRKEAKKSLTTEVSVEPQRENRAEASRKELDYIISPKSPAEIVEQIDPERTTPPIFKTNHSSYYSPSNAHTSKARLSLQNFNVDTPLSSRSPCATPTEPKPSTLDKINESLELIATYLAGIQSDVKELRATQNDILLRLASSSSSAALIALPDEIALPLKCVGDLDNIETWLENDENKENLVCVKEFKVVMKRLTSVDEVKDLCERTWSLLTPIGKKV